MESTPIFPLGIFSMEFFNFQFQEACNGKADDLHVTACSSEHDLSKRKSLILCLESMLQTWRRRMHWFSVGSTQASCHGYLYSNSFWYLLVSQKPSPSQHTYFRSNSSKLKKKKKDTQSFILNFRYVKIHCLIYYSQFKHFFYYSVIL